MTRIEPKVEPKLTPQEKAWKENLERQKALREQKEKEFQELINQPQKCTQEVGKKLDVKG